jgi:hypothetical protein
MPSALTFSYSSMRSASTLLSSAPRGLLGLQLVHVEVVHQAFLGHQRGLLGGAADADAQHAGRAPAGAHGGHGLEHPVDHAVAGVQHHQLALVLAAAALGRDRHVERVARHDLGEDHRGRVVLGVLAVELRVGHDRGAQRVVGVVVAAAHAFVDGVVQAAGEAAPAHVHAHLEEHVDDAGVLADRAVARGAHLAVGEDLRDRVLGGGALLALVGAGQVGDVVGGVVVADVLQRGADRFDQVGLLDRVVMVGEFFYECENAPGLSQPRSASTRLRDRAPNERRLPRSSPRLGDPAVEQRLVHPDPPVRVPFHVLLRVRALAHAQVLGVDVADGQLHHLEQLGRRRVLLDERLVGDDLLRLAWKP